MPKVDPQSGEPMSDAPEGPVETSGGKQAGDPGMEGATETGGHGIGHAETGSDVDDTTDRQLPSEKGGTAAGGSG